MAGVHATNPNVKVLTNFSGNQDDNALSKRVALAQEWPPVGVIFTMLNAGRDGVSQACREKGTRQIGNVIDWVKVDSKVFVASAIADVSIGVFEAVRDAQQGKFPAGSIRKVGIANAQAVRLSMADDVPAAIGTHTLRRWLPTLKAARSRCLTATPARSSPIRLDAFQPLGKASTSGHQNAPAGRPQRPALCPAPAWG